jgi:nicotinate-nucleotide adenylyltransferase
MYGGAFDPPHHAHVALARAAAEQLGLDELRVVPTGDAWHRPEQLSNAQARLAMTRIAFAGLPGVVVDDRELRREGPSYTIDTLRELQSEHPEAELFLVMGEDQALALTQWRNWRSIVAMAAIAYASRPEAMSHAKLELTALPPEARVRRIELPRMPDSATDVRERAARGEDVSSLVPPGVASYIASHHLYRDH